MRSRPAVDEAPRDADRSREQVAIDHDVQATQEWQGERPSARRRPMATMAYKPVRLLLSAGAGAVAGVAYKRIWTAITRQGDPPLSTDKERGWTEILTAAALQGIIFAVVKAVIDRAAATGVHRATGYWPG
jgi:hypothetical protein